MCPVCLGTVILIAAGLSSAGGVLALAKERFAGKSNASKNSPVHFESREASPDFSSTAR